MKGKCRSTCLGMPSIGFDGEVLSYVSRLIKLEEKEDSLIDEFENLCSNVRMQNAKLMLDSGIDIIPAGYFTDYDRVLDTTEMLGNIGRSYYWEGGKVPYDIHFMMITGQQKEKFDVQGMPLRKWFNTNYTYVVPEFSEQLDFAYSDNKIIAHYLELKKRLGIVSRPITLGPISYIMLGSFIGNGDKHSLADILEAMLPVYDDLFQNFMRLGIKDVQLEEPVLVKDLTRIEHAIFAACYKRLSDYAGKLGISLHISTSYGSVGNNLECLLSLPASSIHIDFVNGSDNLDELLSIFPSNMSLSMGLVSAECVFVNDLEKSIYMAEKATDAIGKERVIIGQSSSLAFCPMDAEREVELEASKRECLSFAKQKLIETTIITKAINDGRGAVEEELKKNKIILERIKEASISINNATADVVKNFNARVRLPFKKRHILQNEILKLDVLPITMTGAMPTSKQFFSTSHITPEMEKQIEKCIKTQEPFVDIVVAGEIERSSNIEYFSSLMENIYLTKHNLVSLGNGEVARLPIVFGLPKLNNNHYLSIAKMCLNKVSKPLKFTLQGPISLANRCYFPSFTSGELMQKYFAIEVGKQIIELEKVGVNVVGLDESFCLKQMPLRDEERPPFFRRLGEAFLLCTGQVADKTQLHVYTCHYKFDDCIEQLSCLDADVLLLESSRSRYNILKAFVGYKHNADIAIGLFEPNSLRIATKLEVHMGLRQIIRLLDERQVWVTTDSGFANRSIKDASSCLGIISDAVKEIKKSHQKVK